MSMATAETVCCYIGLGSNQGESLATLHSALQHLNANPHTFVDAVSNFYRSKPVGPQDQPDYVNAVACLQTQLSTEDLLDYLLAVEKQHGRVRDPALRWGPRTLDLDLLLYGDAIIQTERLTVPHPFLCERSFVVYPLFELVGNLKLPNGVWLDNYREKLSANDLTLIPATNSL